MGQYHIVVNLDKKEWIHPHELGCGLKLWEQAASQPSTGMALIILLACSNGRGGGDLEENPIIGRWAGDRIAVVGDYADNGDLPKKFKAVHIYNNCMERKGGWKNITGKVRKIIEKELGGEFIGAKGSWLYWKPNIK